LLSSFAIAWCRAKILPRLCGVIGELSKYNNITSWACNLPKKITKYIALNEFCCQKFIEGGLPASRIVVKPNFVELPTQEKLRRQDFLFVGRLSKEKGIKTLMQAIKLLPDSSIRVAGVGPESELFESCAR
jgi:glycosyltransferase involved in cell wall biosynthesis